MKNLRSRILLCLPVLALLAPVTADAQKLKQRMAETAAKDAATELHIHADGNVAYKQVARLMADAAKAGLTKIGFVTDPRDATP